MSQIFCTNCGAKMDSDARFCSTCGAPNTTLRAAAPQPVYTAPAPAAKPKKKLSFFKLFPWLILLCMIGCVVVLKISIERDKNSDNTYCHTDVLVGDDSIDVEYSGALRDGYPDGEGKAKCLIDGCTLEMEGTWSAASLVKGTRTALFTDDDTITRNVEEGDFDKSQLNGSGKRTMFYTKKYQAETGISRSELTSDFRHGIADGESELTLYYTDEVAAESGIDYTIVTGKYKNGSIIEPYELTYYKGGQIVVKATKERGVLTKDPAYATPLEQLIGTLIDRYSVNLNILEIIGEGIENLFS